MRRRAVNRGTVDCHTEGSCEDAGQEVVEYWAEQTGHVEMMESDQTGYVG